ncbi:MAG: glutathione S-transferase family protein [Halioglobus sp.]
MGKVLVQAGDALSATNEHHLILYDAPASPCARRCRISLIEKGLDWDTVNINLALMEQRSPEYLSINPNGFVPTLAHGKKVIFESSVINAYLEDQFPEVQLMPSRAEGIAKVRMWQASELAMAKVFRPVMYSLGGGLIKRITRTEEESEIIARKATTDAYDLAWDKKVWKLEILDQEEIKQHLLWLENWIVHVEKALQDKDFLVDNAFSQADIAVYPRLQMYGNIGLDISADRYPNVGRWMNSLAKRESFVKSESEGGRKLAELARSDMMSDLRSYYAKPLQLRSAEAGKKIETFGKKLREIQDVDGLLKSSAKLRSLPKPTNNHVVEPRPLSIQECKQPAALILYGSKLSPYSYRIELLLHYLQLPYEYIEVELSEESLRAPEFLAINPLGEVPVLLADSFAVFDSAAIAEYLCSCAPEAHTLRAKNSFDLASQNLWLALEAGTHKEFKPLLQETREGKSAQIDDGKRNLLAARAMEKILPLEDALKNSPYLTGDSICFSDIAWYSRIVFMSKTALRDNIQTLKSIQQWVKTLDKVLQASSNQGKYSNPNAQ